MNNVMDLINFIKVLLTSSISAYHVYNISSSSFTRTKHNQPSNISSAKQKYVALTEDELLKGFNLVEEHENYTTLGHFSDSTNKTRLSKQVIIINQALALRDVVNGKADPIEAAREREAMDYGLLERKWLDEEELDVEGPLAKFINKE